MTSLGYSPVPGDNSNQVLQPTGLANPSNSHFANPNPQFHSTVGATTGCGGAGGSAAALAGKAGYNMARTQTGGRTHRRGGGRRTKKGKKGGKTRKHARSCRCRKCCKRYGRRSMRGGLSTLSPAPFSGAANLPYNQFMNNQQVSYNYGVGGSSAPLPLNEIGTANNRMTDIHNNCGPDYGMVRKGLML